MASAGIELKRTRDVMKNTKRLNEGYEDKMADIAYRLKVVDAPGGHGGAPRLLCARA